MRARPILMWIILGLFATSCVVDPSTDEARFEQEPAAAPTLSTTQPFPSPPPLPAGPVTKETLTALDAYVRTPTPDTIAALGDTGDPRLLWVLSDIIRFAADVSTSLAGTDAAAALSDLDLPRPAGFSWKPLTDHLIAWDLPAFDGYPDYKAAIFTAYEPDWQIFFDDDSAIDWRLVSWGGVGIDGRPLGDPNPCATGCIPALDDPVLTAAESGDWLPDDAIVFGIRVGDDTVALPKNIMEVHEMVNATVGGRRVAIPYCTLCGAAQLFFTDSQVGDADQIVMRTSGLLHRSNKVMYDLTTNSVFDTFTGRAVSGPLYDDAVVLQQGTVVTSRWDEWRRGHPETQIVAQDGGIGRTYPSDPLGGRDDDGPIFPIGDHDPRLGVQEQVLGIVLPDGVAVAFPVTAAQQALAQGGQVDFDGVTVMSDAGGLNATYDGQPIASHQAFWFAWSQFNPDTRVWQP